ncbi:TetR-like C-terminal domain-containing protein [Paenibacillus pini]|uniref:TetR-like C-terminal domain-containing protein n=1 Tax=Paenibacillus pini TaxID=669461 RepID=UPI00130E36BB|nr:TetR-like C-terminal domain-containing protein [Paenibacillus pini]
MKKVSEEQHTLHTVHGLRSLLHGFASLEQNHGFRMQLDLNESLAYTLRMFLHGLKLS